MTVQHAFLENPPPRVAKQLLYIVYGDNINYQIETKLSILSVLRHTAEANFSIRVMTDQVAAYEGWPVDVLAFTPQLLEDWLGPTHHHYRRKTMGILTALDYAEQTIFLDTDTLLKDNANELFGLFKEGEVLVDTVDGTWGDCKQDSVIAKISAYLEKTHPEFDESLKVVNSGVLGFFTADKPLLETAVNFIDEMSANADPDCRLLEQFSFALCLDKQRKLVEHQHIYHYWSKKEFFHEMGQHFFTKYGFNYQRDYPVKSKEIPIAVIRPTFLSRFMGRLKIKPYPKKLRSGLLKLYYALQLNPNGHNGYEGDQIVAYWSQSMRKDFSQYDEVAYQEFQAGQWPVLYQKIASSKQRQALLAFLKDRGAIN